MEEPVKINILLLPTALMKPGSICGIVHVRQLSDSGLAYLGVNVINSVKYPTYLTISIKVL